MGTHSAAIEALRALPWLARVPLPALHEFVRMAPPLSWKPGEVVFRQGEPAEEAFLLLDGELFVMVGIGAAARQVGVVRPGELFGEAALYRDGQRRSATVIAHPPSFGLRLSRELLWKGIHNPVLVEIEVRALAAVARRIRRTNLAVQKAWAEVGGTPPPTRRVSFARRVLDLLSGRWA